jgi:hypothetical protein
LDSPLATLFNKNSGSWVRIAQTQNWLIGQGIDCGNFEGNQRGGVVWFDL